MSKLSNIVLAAIFGFAVSTVSYAAETPGGTTSPAWSEAKVKAAMDKCHKLDRSAQARCVVNIRPTADTSYAWNDAQINAARDKCNSLSGTAQAKCIVNIRPVTSADNLAMYQGSVSADENVVKAGTGTEEEYTAAIKECESANVADRERCVSNAKDHFGRM